MLGSLKDILELLPVPRQLEAEYETIVATALKSSPAQMRPTLIHLAGVPGSGKSTYANELRLQHVDKYLLDFDAVMEALSGYREHVEAHGLESAFRAWEMPARSLGYHLLIALLEHRRSIIFDHSASNTRHLEIIRVARDIGYRTEMHYLPCSPEIALARVESRSVHDVRFTPAHLIIERTEALKKLLPLYRPLVDNFVQVSAQPASASEFAHP